MITSPDIEHAFNNINDFNVGPDFINYAVNEIFGYLADYPSGNIPTSFFLYRNNQLRAIATTRESSPELQGQVTTELASTCYLASPDVAFLAVEMLGEQEDQKAIALVLFTDQDMSISLHPYTTDVEDSIEEIHSAFDISNQKIDGLEMDFLNTFQYTLFKALKMRSRPELMHLYMETLQERYVKITQISS